MPSLNNVLDTIGLEASGSSYLPDTPVSREYVLPIAGAPGLDTEINKEADPAIAGKNMASGSYLLSKNGNDGGTPITPRAIRSMILLLHSCLGGGTLSGGNVVGTQIGAVVRIKYNTTYASGTEKNYCKFTIDQTADELSALTGDVRGTLTDDANWNSGSAYDISTGTGNTIDDLLTAIGKTDATGWAGFSAELVMGDRSIAMHELILFDAADDEGREGGDTWCFLYFASTTTGVYAFEMPVVLTNTERPTLSRQVDNRGGNEVWTGWVNDVMSISAALNAFAEGNIQGPGLTQRRPKTGITGTTEVGTTVTHIDTRELIPGMTIASAAGATVIPASTTIASISDYSEDGTLVLSQAALSATTLTDILVDITASTLDLDDASPFVFCTGKTSVDGSLITYIRNFSLEMNNNHAADIGYGQGKCSRQLQQKGMFDATGTIQLAMDSDIYALRQKAQDGDRIAMHFELRGEDLGNYMKAYMIIELPYSELMTYTRPENSGQIDASMDYKAINPAGTNWNNPCKITLILAQSTT